MNLKQLEAFVKVTESGSFSKSGKAFVPDAANGQCTYLFSGERTGLTAFCQKYKGSKIVGRRKAIISVCAPDGGTRKRNRAGIFQGCAS